MAINTRSFCDWRSLLATRLAVLFLFVMMLAPGRAASTDLRANVSWPAFRGFDGSGAGEPEMGSEEGSKPSIQWKSPLPGSGLSSPIVHDDTIYVTAAYATERGRVIYLTSIRIAVAIVLWLALIAFSRSQEETSKRLLFNRAGNVGLLFLLVAAGKEISGCNDDPFRTTVLASLMAAAALNTARLVAGGSRGAQLFIFLAGLAAVCFGNFMIWKMPVVRQPGILISATLLPFFVGLLTICRGSSEREASKWLKLAPWLIGALPLIAFVAITIKTETSEFWRIQLTNSLGFSRGYKLLSAGILLTGGICFWLGRKWPKASHVGVIWLAWGATLALPVVLSPMVNAFQYSKYQLVRGHIGSPLGLKGLVWAGTLMALSSLAPLARWGSWRWPKLVLCGLPLAAVLLPQAGEVFGNAGGTVCAIVAVDLQTGERKWIAEGLRGESANPISSFNSAATPTPTISGDLVVGYFGDRGAFACRRDNGAIAWVNTDLPYRSGYGAASSLIGTEAVVVVQSDSDGFASYVEGISPANGKLMWKSQREPSGSWRSPILFSWKGRPVVCSWSKYECDFLDLQTGKRLKRIAEIQLGSGDPVTSPLIVGSQLLLAAADWLVALPLATIFEAETEEVNIDLPGESDVPENKAAARLKPAFSVSLEGDGPTCVTPACDGNRVFLVSDSGVLWWISLPDGKVFWKGEVGATKSSPVLAGGNLYLGTDGGAVEVLGISGKEGRRIASLDMGESIGASPAIAGKSLIVRTKTKLMSVRIGSSIALNR